MRPEPVLVDVLPHTQAGEKADEQGRIKEEGRLPPPDKLANLKGPHVDARGARLEVPHRSQKKKQGLHEQVSVLVSPRDEVLDPAKLRPVTDHDVDGSIQGPRIGAEAARRRLLDDANGALDVPQ